MTTAPVQRCQAESAELVRDLRARRIMVDGGNGNVYDIADETCEQAADLIEKLTTAPRCDCTSPDECSHEGRCIEKYLRSRAPAQEPKGGLGALHVSWSDEDYSKARDCMIGLLRGHAWTIADGSRGVGEFDNAFQHAVGILALTALAAPSTNCLTAE